MNRIIQRFDRSQVRTERPEFLQNKQDPKIRPFAPANGLIESENTGINNLTLFCYSMKIHGMAKTGFTKKDEYQIIYTGKRYYLTIEDNQKGKQIKVKEWTKSSTTRPASTRVLLIYENHLPDMIKALTAIEKRLEKNEETLSNS